MALQRALTVLIVSQLFLSFGTIRGQSCGGAIGIHGRVMDENGDPLPGVKVTAVLNDDSWRRMEKTDDSGRYFLHCLRDGGYNLLLEFEGFFTQTVSGIEWAFPNVLRLNHFMSLGAKARAPLRRKGLSILVQDPSGGVLADVEVSVRRASREVAVGLTSVCGRLYFYLEKGEYLVLFKALGHESVTALVTLHDSRVLHVQTLKERN